MDLESEISFQDLLLYENSLSSTDSKLKMLPQFFPHFCYIQTKTLRNLFFPRNGIKIFNYFTVSIKDCDHGMGTIIHAFVVLIK